MYERTYPIYFPNDMLIRRLFLAVFIPETQFAFLNHVCGLNLFFFFILIHTANIP